LKLPTLPAGWNNATLANGGELKFRTESNATIPGQGTLAVVARSRPNPTYLTLKEQRTMLSGVSFSDLRRIAIDKMINAGGWVINDYERQVNGARVFVVIAQTPSDAVHQRKAWNFYFAEVDGKIYSLTLNTPVEFSNQLTVEGEKFISSLALKASSSVNPQQITRSTIFEPATSRQEHFPMSLTDTATQLSLSELLRKLSELGGSDLHITTGSAPQVRVDGHLRPLEGYRLMTAADTKQLAYSVLTDAQKHRFEENLELDFSFGVKGLSRFRANLFNQRGAVGCVFRAIPYEIKAFEDLGLPEVVKKLCDKPRGLILVTGPTGSGKSTTLAAMVDKINRDRHEHILTIEDPIEFLHNHKSCLVNQREVNADTHGFSQALRTALRQDPDVVLVGEMRDLETIESAYASRKQATLPSPLSTQTPRPQP